MALFNTRIALIAATSVLVGAAGSAQAADKYEVTALNKMLTTWNVIVLGKDRSKTIDTYDVGKLKVKGVNALNTGVYNIGNQHVDGRVFAGGNMIAGNGTVNLNGTAKSTDPKSSTYNVPGLTVVGSVIGGTVKVGNQGGASIGGSTTTTYFAGSSDGKIQVGSTGLQQGQKNSNFYSGINTPKSAYYDKDYLSSLTSEGAALTSRLMGASAGFAKSANTTGDYWTQSKTGAINLFVTGKGVTAGGNQLHFINIGASDLLGFRDINFFSNTKGTASAFDGTLVVNVSGNLSAMTLTNNFNQTGFGKNVLFNFYQETGTVTIDKKWQASILAPQANGIVGAGSVEGLTVFNTLTQTNSEIHFADCTNVAFRGAVPETSTWAMMLIGFGAVGGAMRRRRTGAALAVRG